MPTTPPAINQGIPGPDKLTLDGDPATNFKRFKRGWSVYETGSRIDAQQDNIRAAILQSYLSADVLELLETLPFDSNDDRKDAQKILTVLENHFYWENE